MPDLRSAYELLCKIPASCGASATARGEQLAGSIGDAIARAFGAAADEIRFARRPETPTPGFTATVLRRGYRIDVRVSISDHVEAGWRDGHRYAPARIAVAGRAPCLERAERLYGHLSDLGIPLAILSPIATAAALYLASGGHLFVWIAGIAASSAAGFYVGNAVGHWIGKCLCERAERRMRPVLSELEEPWERLVSEVKSAVGNCRAEWDGGA